MAMYPHPKTLTRMADRLEEVHGKNRKDTKLLVQLLRTKANKRNRKSSETDELNNATGDGYAGYSVDTFAQGTQR